MSDIDFERASALLNIIKQCADIGTMNNIVAEAQAELMEINEAAAENVAERQKAKAEEEWVEPEVAEDNPPPAPGEVEPEPEPDPTPAYKPDQEPKPSNGGRKF